MFCIISHIVSLACNDKAFRFPDTTPRMVLTLGVRPGLNCQPIQWRDEMLDVPIFRLLGSSDQRTGRKPDGPLPYGLYHGWVKRLGEETGFVQVLTTYCLRRAAGNAINGEPRRLGPKERFANHDRRPQLERGGAQSDPRPCHFDDLPTELPLSYDSLRHASDLSRHRVARGSDRCFSSDESHDRSTPTSRALPSTTAGSTTGCKHSRAARAAANPLRSDPQKVQLHLPGRRSTDLR